MREQATYLIPKLEPANPSGVNARVASVPVFHSADVASSTTHSTVVLALGSSPVFVPDRFVAVKFPVIEVAPLNE